MPDVSIVRYASPYVPAPAVAQARRSAFSLISQLLLLQDVSEKHLKEQLSIGLWKWTESVGVAPHAKFNLPFVSNGVLHANGPTSINHEHVWTRKWIIERLRARRKWPADELLEFLTTYGVACVVTVEEHALLSGVTGQGWDRYVAAGIGVWDRQRQQPLNLSDPEIGGHGRGPVAVQVREPGGASVDHALDVGALVDEKAEPEAAYRLHRLLRMARFASATAVPSLKADGRLAGYFRVHDTLIGEPTPAVAYPHWSGRVAFRLRPDDVPEWMAGDPQIQVLQQSQYALQVRVVSDSSLALAEELLFVALEKLREGYAA